MRLHTPVWVLAFVFPFFVFHHADYSFSMFLSTAACRARYEDVWELQLRACTLNGPIPPRHHGHQKYIQNIEMYTYPRTHHFTVFVDKLSVQLVRKSLSYWWMSPSLTNATSHWSRKPVVGECPSQSISHQHAASRYWQAVHCLHFPGCFQYSGSWFYFTVLRCYRVLASHQPTITPPLSTTSVAKLSQWILPWTHANPRLVYDGMNVFILLQLKSKLL